MKNADRNNVNKTYYDKIGHIFEEEISSASEDEEYNIPKSVRHKRNAKITDVVTMTGKRTLFFKYEDTDTKEPEYTRCDLLIKGGWAKFQNNKSPSKKKKEFTRV